jgi:hypothetical protein
MLALVICDVWSDADFLDELEVFLVTVSKLV